MLRAGNPEDRDTETPVQVEQQFVNCAVRSAIGQIDQNPVDRQPVERSGDLFS